MGYPKTTKTRTTAGLRRRKGAIFRFRKPFFGRLLTEDTWVEVIFLSGVAMVQGSRPEYIEDGRLPYY